MNLTEYSLYNSKRSSFPYILLTTLEVHVLLGCHDYIAVWAENLAVWWSACTTTKLKSANGYFILAYMRMVISYQTTKLKSTNTVAIGLNHQI